MKDIFSIILSLYLFKFDIIKEKIINTILRVVIIVYWIGK